MSTTTTENHRLYLRGETANFIVNFFEDAAGTVPAIPLDISLYPAYEIFDINNNVVQSGLGSPEVSPGRYKVDFIVPPTAPLSNDLQRWRIEWTLVSTTNRQVDYVEEFDIKDTVITASETREQKFITLAGEDYRALMRLPEVPYQVRLNIFNAASNIKLATAVSGVTNGLQESTDGDSIVYSYVFPASASGLNCFFSLIWGVQNTPTESQSFHYQSLTAVTPSVLNFITCLRMIVDKLQKRLGTVQAYEDSDLVEYSIRGQELVNSVYPTTFYSFGALPQGLTVYHLLFSAWYALQAQRILNVELGFNFSGQTTTLDFDQASGLADVASTWNDFIQENLSAAKQGILRASSPVGTVAGRQYRYNSYNNFIYKIASYPQGANNVIGQLQTLGLLW